MNRFGIQTLELLELEAARRHLPQDVDDHHLRALLQHYHGKTNAIDFTTDINIALFFACDGRYDQPGRIIWLNPDNTTCDIDHPDEPAQRIAAQKSVFVLPEHGYISYSEYRTHITPKRMKRPILAYLRKYHGIAEDSVHNDLLGFIHYRNNYQNRIMERNAQALNLIDSGERENAIAMFGLSITNDPDSELTYRLRLRASAHHQADDLSKAIADLNEAIQLLGFNPEAYALRSLCLHEIGDLKEAIKDANVAIQQDPEFGIAYSTRGLILTELGNWHAAMQDFSDAIYLDPNLAVAYNNRGFLYLLQRHFTLAIRNLDEAIALQPDLASPT